MWLMETSLDDCMTALPVAAVGSNVENEIFPKARQTPAKAHSSFSARKGHSSDGSEGF